jgi:hypothetical protein
MAYDKLKDHGLVANAVAGANDEPSTPAPKKSGGFFFGLF